MGFGSVGIHLHFRGAFDARLRVASVGARDLIEDNWPSVQAVAEELLRKKTVSADEVAKLVIPRLLAA